MSDDELFQAAPPGDDPSQIPPKGPARERWRCQRPARPRTPKGSPTCCHSTSGIDGRNGNRQREPEERAKAVTVPPREHRQRGQQCDAGDARQDRKPGQPAGEGEPVALGERTPRARAADRATRCTRPAERAPSGRSRGTGLCATLPPAEPLLRELVEEGERPEARRERDHDAREHVVAEEGTSDHGDDAG